MYVRVRGCSHTHEVCFHTLSHVSFCIISIRAHSVSRLLLEDVGGGEPATVIRSMDHLSARDVGLRITCVVPAPPQQSPAARAAPGV